MAIVLRNVSSSKRRGFIVAALAVAIIYVGIALATDAAQLKLALDRLGTAGCILVLGLSLTNYLLRFFRWQHYIIKLGRVLPFFRHLTYYLAGFAFTVSPAKAGEAVRSLYLVDHGVSYADSLAALFIERLLDLCAMVLLASLVIIDHSAYRPLLGGVLVIVVSMVFLVCRPALPTWLDGWGDRVSGRAAMLSRACAALLRSARTLLRAETLLFGLVAGMLAWGAEGVGFYVICHTLHIVVSPSIATGIYAISVLAGSAAFFLPAGIGGMEIVMTGLLMEQGAAIRTAIIATLVCRLATLWFAVLIGILSALRLELASRHKLTGVSL